MTDQEKLALTVGTEFDFYLNMAKEGVSDRNVKMFITRIVIPRMMKLKAILGHYEENEFTWKRRREMEAEFMATQKVEEQMPE